MLLENGRRFLKTSIDQPSKTTVRLWLILSLVFVCIYSFEGLKEAFSSAYVIQDDVRQHVFWMQRFLDPKLFPNDWIADYYQSAAPLGYTTLYRLLATIGIDPILVSKLLPIVLGIATTAYAFGFCLQILPVPAAGFIFTLLLNYMLWGGGILITATSRAFFWPFFFAFLYYLLRRSLFPCLIAIALQGLFYPPSELITSGILILRLFRWEGGLPRLSLDRNNYLFCFTGLAVVFLVLLPEVLSSSPFGPTITVAEARTLPEFYPGGRTTFFQNKPENFWINNHRSGLMGWPWQPPILYAALLLPILMRYPSRFPLARHVSPGINLLSQLLFVSLSLFFIAHAVLFKLYLPSRYAVGVSIVICLATAIALVLILDAVFQAGKQQPTKITLKALALFFAVYAFVVTVYWLTLYSPGNKTLLVSLLALGAGITLILFLLDWVWYRAKQGSKPYLGRLLLALASTAVVTVTLLAYPSVLDKFPRNDYVVGKEPQIYQFFAQQSKDILIASLASEADNLPSFAKRSILVGREYALPYQVGYYKEIRQRAIDLIDAQYSPDLKQVKSVIQKYGIDFWLLEREAFKPEYITNGSWQSSWIRQYQPAATKALQNLKQGIVPALAKITPRCSALETGNLVVVGAECITKAPQE